jgi:hypothetical protein
MLTLRILSTPRHNNTVIDTRRDTFFSLLPLQDTILQDRRSLWSKHQQRRSVVWFSSRALESLSLPLSTLLHYSFLPSLSLFFVDFYLST